MLKLYTFPIAPNPSKVMYYIEERRSLGAELPVQYIKVDLSKGEHRSEAALRRNPGGGLPVLELENGRYITESLAIIEYLEDLFTDHRMWSGDVETRAFQRQTERIADIGVLMNGGRLVHAENSPLGLPKRPEVAEYFRNFLPGTYSRLEDQIAEGGPWLCGDTVSVADCTLYAALGFMEFGGVMDLAEYPELSQWRGRYAERPAVARAFSNISL